MTTESGGLSKEEFLLIQEQLLQLRNENYELREELKKKSQPQNSTKNEALQFASKLINRASKKDEKDGEIDALRRKMESQEEEFRLQQETLFVELKNLSAQNMQLKTQMSSYSDHPLEKEAGGFAEMEKQVKALKEENESLCKEKVPFLNRKISNLAEKLKNSETLNVELEDRVLALTAEAEAVYREKQLLDVENCRVMHEIEAFRKEHSEIVEEMHYRNKEVVDENKKLIDEKKVLSEKIATLKQKLTDQSEEIESLKTGNQELKEHSQKFLDEKISEFTLESDALKAKNALLTSQLENAIAECENNQEKAIDDRVLLLETRYQLEVDLQKKSFEEEREDFQLKISSLIEKLKSSEEEKKIALKKQQALVKELQKSLKEERKRADSYERKSEERAGWHVVPPEIDRNSSHTFDGNESVSSLSAIESENVELITRLATLQKIHSENADTIMHLESENSRLRREVAEKGELIENLIREKPLGFGNPHSPSFTGQPRLEVSFRKLLNTLGQDPSASDVKEMNKKLQRMLEETLSKNIILQRDLQTLMERTGL